MKAERLLL